MRLLQIDRSNLGDHARLTDHDVCLHLYEYTSGQNYKFSKTNQLISNLKKKPAASEGELYWKNRAIRQCGDDLRASLDAKWLAGATIVPVPGSKAKDDPNFDDRMERIARLIRPGQDVRNLVVQTASTVAAHEALEGDRITVEELLVFYQIDEALTEPEPTKIVILDDVLTAGTHFRAMQIVLSGRFPPAAIFGLFVAHLRRPAARKDRVRPPSPRSASSPAPAAWTTASKRPAFAPPWRWSATPAAARLCATTATGR
jgi:predicted amidophosphoribosyltransferase